MELLRPVRVLGSEQARSAEQRERLGDLLGQMAEDGASDVLAEARAAGNPHVRGSDQDVLAVDLQPQVHRQHPGIFFQYLTWPRLLPPNRSITTTTSSG